MYRSSTVIVLLICFFSFLNCKASKFDFSRSDLLIVSNGDNASILAADYFYYHLSKRNIDKSDFIVSRSDENVSQTKLNKVYFEVVSDLKSDYEIANAEGQLSIFVRNNAVSIWLSYMLIDHFGKFHKLDVTDLLPAFVNFDSAKVDLAFRYRDPHLMPNLNQEMSGLLLTHNVDHDWGIWGHNFGRVFLEKPSLASLALVKGKRDEEQYCFSAKETLEATKSYILENYGKDNRDSLWFMISPNDNDKVCLCDLCKAKGNTEKNASPAVTELMNNLSNEFPNDYFYTIAYRTTQEAPESKMSKNTGVLISTVDLAKSPLLNQKDAKTRRFEFILNNWKHKTEKVYLWDYISNFDDYLIPYPMLLRVQQQMIYFKNLGVTGIFMNGSGYDYSPFDDVKTYVLSALLIDPKLSVPDLVAQYHQRFYPKTASLLTRYLLHLENKMFKENRDINIYTSSAKAIDSYFDKTLFQDFYQSLLGIENQLEGEEKKKIERLLAALSYVQLQINYHQATLNDGFFEVDGGNLRVSSKMNFHLSRLKKSLDHQVVKYKEEKGDLKVYLNEWDKLLQANYPINRIKHIQVNSLLTGETLNNSAVLYDNIIGFDSDFNQGWFLAADDIKINGEHTLGKKRKANLRMKFLANKRHRMLPPERVEILFKGAVVHSFSKNDYISNEESVSLQKELDISNDGLFEIKVYKNLSVKKSVIACDEIQVF